MNLLPALVCVALLLYCLQPGKSPWACLPARYIKFKTTLVFSFMLLALVMPSMAQVVNVSTPTQLQNALNNALPGQTIVIADGSYNSSSGNFTIPAGVNGTVSQPITLKGSRNAILTTADSAHGYGLYLAGNKYWVIKGFTTRYCKNGIVADNSQYITIDSVLAKKTGQEAIHLRTFSSYCMVKNCFIDSTGLLIPGEGEGIYMGSAVSNWCTYTACNADTCNYDTAYNNSFGLAVSAENIDIKEGTKGGYIQGNHFNGAGLSNQNGGDSWIDVKGNYYIIENNDGVNSVLDGYQTHIASVGYGNFNTIRDNVLAVNGPGYGIRVQTSGTNGTANGNIICNNNVVTGAALGTANVPTQTCGVVLASDLLYWNARQEGDKVACTWKISNPQLFGQFVIEGSSDGIQFDPLFRTNVLGNSYRFEVPGNLAEGRYYRLKLFHTAGQATYSGVIYVKAFLHTFNIYRSGNSLVTVNKSGQFAAVKIYDAQGALLTSLVIPNGSTTYPIVLQSGIYFACFNELNEGRKVVRFIW